MIKPLYDAVGHPIIPTIVLCRRNYDKIGTIYPIEKFNITPDLKTLNELSFTIHKVNDGKILPLWNEIRDLRIIYIPEYDEYFEISINRTISNDITKAITAENICKAELGQTILHDIQINTTDDIDRDEYIMPTLLYRDSISDVDWYKVADGKYKDATTEEKEKLIKKASLLDRVLSKAPHYHVEYVDSTIKNILKEFTIDGKSIHDFLDGDFSSEYQCLVRYSSSKRAIGVYDLCDNCLDCGEREEFMNGVCPKCGSTNIKEGYGEDTTVFISRDNLASNIQVSTNKDGVKNTFRIVGGDDDVTAAVAAINPNGTQYINCFSDDTMDDMTDDLKDKLREYNEEYKKYINGENGYPKYSDITKKIYDTLDQILYLKDGMMPTPEIKGESPETEVAKLTKDSLSPVAVQSLKSASDTTVTSAIKAIAQTFISSGFKLEVDSHAYDKNENIWHGKFKVTLETDKDQYAISKEVVDIVINEDYTSFVFQKMKKILAKADMEDEEIDYKLYGLNSLKGFSDAYQSCLDVLIEWGLGNPDNEFYDDFYYPYYKRKMDCDAEILVREAEIAEQERILAEAEEQRDEIQNALNLEKFVGETLWSEYCAFRREDDYKNEHYSSEDLDNAGLLKKADELFTVAKKEIEKACETQYTITSTIGNLFAMKEFEQLKNMFKIGNWIRFEADNRTYKVRLMNYTIKEDDLANLTITLSNVIETRSYISDVKNILSSSQNMATSYESVKRQAKNSEETLSKTVDDWLQNGLNATGIQINNSENQTVTYDNHGLLCREYDDIGDTYMPELLRIVNNVIAISDDSGETYKAALGKIKYEDPITGEIKDAYGVIGDTIVGKLLVGEKASIGNKDGSVEIDKDGVVIKKGEIKLTSEDGSTSAEITKDGILKAKGAEIEGNIIADSGKIGNTVIENGNLVTEFWGMIADGFYKLYSPVVEKEYVKVYDEDTGEWEDTGILRNVQAYPIKIEKYDRDGNYKSTPFYINQSGEVVLEKYVSYTDENNYEKNVIKITPNGIKTYVEIFENGVESKLENLVIENDKIYVGSTNDIDNAFNIYRDSYFRKNVTVKGSVTCQAGDIKANTLIGELKDSSLIKTETITTPYDAIPADGNFSMTIESKIDGYTPIGILGYTARNRWVVPSSMTIGTSGKFTVNLHNVSQTTIAPASNFVMTVGYVRDMTT